MNLALNNLQRLICHKTQTNKQSGFPYAILGIKKPVTFSKQATKIHEKIN